MTVEPSWVAIGLTAFGGMFAFMWALSSRITKIEVKLENVNQMLWRQASSEAVNKGAAAMNSPIELTPEAAEWFPDDLIARLKAFYQSHGRGMGEKEFLLEVERHFGMELLEKIAVPRHLISGAATMLVVKIAKGSPVVERPANGGGGPVVHSAV